MAAIKTDPGCAPGEPTFEMHREGVMRMMVDLSAGMPADVPYVFQCGCVGTWDWLRV